jgi:UDP-glucose 4-epimerase
MLKILVLGSEGFVGHNLVHGLDKNHEVFTADQLASGFHKNYKQMDIRNFESVLKTIKDVDAVINLIAHTLVSSLDDVIENARVNILGLLNVLESCRKNDISKIIFTSASSIIGKPEDFHVSERHALTPKTAYGITKMASEHYLRLYNEMFGIRYVVFRFFNIYGPYQLNGLIPSLYSKISRNQPLTIFGKGDQVRDYVYIEDIIPFFEKSASTKIADNLIFNMGTGKGTKISQVIDYFSQILGIRPQIEYEPERLGEIGNFVADTALLHSTFESIPKTTLKDGLKKTISWLQTQ